MREEGGGRQSVWFSTALDHTSFHKKSTTGIVASDHANYGFKKKLTTGPMRGEKEKRIVFFPQKFTHHNYIVIFWLGVQVLS